MCSLRFTPGATPADILMTSMYLQADIRWA